MIFLLLASCTGIGSHAAASGVAYKNSQEAALKCGNDEQK